MTPLESAITQLREEIDSFGHGGTDGTGQPHVKDGTSEFYLLRAKVLGMGWLKRVQELGLQGDHAASHRLYAKAGHHFKSATPPASAAVERERLPDGSLPSGTL